MLLYPSDLLTHFKEDAEKLNIRSGCIPKLDFESLIDRVNEDVSRTSASIAKGYEKSELIDFYPGHARFIENKIIEVNGERISGEKIYIATGSRPFIPEIEGLAETDFFTSRELLKNRRKPRNLIIIGGGYIATELGYFYAAA